jgi:hypothetical protein
MYGTVVKLFLSLHLHFFRHLAPCGCFLFFVPCAGFLAVRIHSHVSNKLISRFLFLRLFCVVISSDVNVHETNSFFKANFQFVSISKQNVVFYSYVALSESKIRPISFKNFKEILKPKRNEMNFQVKVKKRIVFDTKKAKL